MKTFVFEFEFRVNKLTRKAVERLAELQGGKPDCSCLSTGGKHFVTYYRRAGSLGAAIDSAVSHCKKAGLKVKEIRIGF